MPHYRQTETIISEANCDLIVAYTFQTDQERNIESITLESVEIVIGGQGISLLEQMGKRARSAIIATLRPEDTPENKI